jgi:hypothetical protein
MINSVRILDKEQYETDKKDLLEILKSKTIPVIAKNRYRDGKIIVFNRENIIGPIGRTCNFGLVRSRQFGYRTSRFSKKWPELNKSIFKFVNHICPAGMDVTSITLNHGVKAKKHKDGFNIGDSVIVGIGEYEEGKLRVYSDETQYVAHDIKDKPLMFNGALLAHETEDFTGDRYTIIIYSHRPKKRTWTVEIPVVGTGTAEPINTLNPETAPIQCG